MLARPAVVLGLFIGCTDRAPEPLSEMVTVPGGQTTIGCAVDCGTGAIAQRTVGIGTFEIDRFEVTVGDWGGCVTVGVCEPIVCNFRSGSAREPMGCVTQRQAADFCAWRGKRLPHELEWEKAARGTDGRRYPWGDEAPGFDCAWANWECSMQVTDVGSFPDGVSPYGVYDMIGNVAEYALAWDVVTDPERYEVWRGGDAANRWLGGDTNAQASSRYVTDRKGFQAPSRGFRCAR